MLPIKKTSSACSFLDLYERCKIAFSSKIIQGLITHYTITWCMIAKYVIAP